MYRFSSLTVAFSLALFSPSAIASETASPDSSIELALMRPSIPTQAASEPRVTRSPRKPLAARFTPAADLITLVDVSEQTMTVFIGGIAQHVWPVSTAGKGYKTPRGMWQPYRMHTMWHSRKYDNAPMPHSIFYDGGYAIHATPHIRRLGKPASHGCVRLHPDNAKALFDLVLDYGRANMRVVVQN